MYVKQPERVTREFTNIVRAAPGGRAHPPDSRQVFGLFADTNEIPSYDLTLCRPKCFVLLGPVIWPWYYAWAFVFLAVVAQGWTLRVVAALSAVACFATVPTPRLLISAPAPDLVVGWLLLGALVLIGVGAAIGTGII